MRGLARQTQIIEYLIRPAQIDERLDVPRLIQCDRARAQGIFVAKPQNTRGSAGPHSRSTRVGVIAHEG